AQTHHPAEAAALLRRPAEQPYVERDDQNRRAESEYQPTERRGARLDRLGRDLDAVLDQQRLEPGIDEGRQGRLERRAGTRLPARRGRLASASAAVRRGGRRVGHGLDEAAFDALALVVDFRHI